MKLSICFPVYDDFDGLYFSASDIPLRHPEVCDDIEIVVVDNHPESPHGQACKNWVEGYLSGSVKARYIAAPGPGGPALTKQRCVDEAAGDFVLVMDSHVRLAAGALSRLIKFFDAHPDTKDLYSGPLCFDTDYLRVARGERVPNCTTHMERVWRGHDLGIWASDPRGFDVDAEPFEIPAQGAGLFACRREAFVGFNPNVRGFGGEEFDLYDRTRMAGGKGILLPFLRWIHRFGRPGGAPYAVTVWDKMRNYVLTHQDRGESVDPIYEHFVAIHKHILTIADLRSNDLTEKVGAADWERLNNDKAFMEARAFARTTSQEKAAIKEFTFSTTGGVSEADWKYLMDDPIGHITPPVKPGCGTCGGGRKPLDDSITLDDLYKQASETPSDINEHCAKLRELATMCPTIVEFGHRRGVSTVAMLHGQPDKLTSYDIHEDPVWRDLQARQGKTTFQFIQADVTAIDIEDCDLLFEDARHTAAHIDAILSKHAGKVRRFIAFHDTVIFGETGEDGGPGILPALRKFVKAHREWSVVYHSQANHGFTVLGKMPEDKPKLPPLTAMAWNLTKAMAEHAKNGFKVSTEEQAEGRLDVCALCDQRRDTRCAVCGCFVDIKATLDSSECPLGKWMQ